MNPREDQLCLITKHKCYLPRISDGGSFVIGITDHYSNVSSGGLGGGVCCHNSEPDLGVGLPVNAVRIQQNQSLTVAEETKYFINVLF